MRFDRRARTVCALGLAQTLAWGSSYYLPAMLADPMARDLGLSEPAVFAAFSAALFVSALVGPAAGRAIDRWGGRHVLMGTNGVFALALVVLAFAHDVPTLVTGWLLLGVGMGSGLYEGAFAALVRLYGAASRGAITGVTLIGGFASTVSWPLSRLLEAHLGWRGACLVWAALHVVIGWPAHASIPRAGAIPVARPTKATSSAELPTAVPRRATWLLAIVFAITWFIATAMAAHLPRVLVAGGATLAGAVFVGALVGPAQVGARLLEFGLLRRLHPYLAARLAALMHPLGVGVMAIFGASAAPAFGLLHGAGNGILTIAKGTLPLAIFGPAGYGYRQGMLMVPARIAQALAPWLFGLGIDRFGAQSLWLTAGLGLVAFAALLALPRTPA